MVHCEEEKHNDEEEAEERRRGGNFHVGQNHAGEYVTATGSIEFGAEFGEASQVQKALLKYHPCVGPRNSCGMCCKFLSIVLRCCLRNLNGFSGTPSCSCECHDARATRSIHTNHRGCPVF